MNTNGVCKNNLTLCSFFEGKSHICIDFREKTVSEKAEIFRIFRHESIAHGQPMICPWSAHDLPRVTVKMMEDGNTSFLFQIAKKMLNENVKNCIENFLKNVKNIWALKNVKVHLFS